MSTETANLTCPRCNFDQEVKMPNNKSLLGHRCEKCTEVLIASPEGGHSCVICQYSNKKCPQNK